MSKDVLPLMIFVAQEGKCFHCDQEFTGKGSGPANQTPRKWTRDHVHVASQGYGKAFNTVLACGTCNRSRGTRPLTPPELARAEAIFTRTRTIWTAFYGSSAPFWTSDPKQVHLPVPQVGA